MMNKTDITLTYTSKHFADVQFNLITTRAEAMLADLEAVRVFLYGKDSDMPLPILIVTAVANYRKQIEEAR